MHFNLSNPNVIDPVNVDSWMYMSVIPYVRLSASVIVLLSLASAGTSIKMLYSFMLLMSMLTKSLLCGDVVLLLNTPNDVAVQVLR